MKVLVCGSREWLTQPSIERELKRFPKGTILVHGACRGADNIAGFVGNLLGFEVRPYPVTEADWDQYGRAAGLRRNLKMLESEHPDATGVVIDHLLAFHHDPRLGRGTKHMVELAKRANPKIDIEVFFR